MIREGVDADIIPPYSNLVYDILTENKFKPGAKRTYYNMTAQGKLLIESKGHDKRFYPGRFWAVERLTISNIFINTA